jgi:hypothetical protein
VSTSVEPSPSENDVRESRPAACWSVQGCDWRDELPAEVTALLAPSVVVSAEVFAPRVPRPGGQANSKPAGYGPRHAAADESPAPRFLKPGLPRRHRRPTSWTGGGWRSAPQVDPITSRL